MKLNRWALALNLICLSPLIADDAAPSLVNESELGVVISAGNSDTQTFNLKHQSTYVWEKNTVKGFARYLKGNTNGVASAENWEIGARYEREFTASLSGFTQYRLDKNRFAFLDLRHAVDAGAKYFFVKSDEDTIFNETGYRFMSEDRLNPVVTVSSHFARFYFEWLRKWTPSVNTKVGLELLPNLSTSSDYQANLEASVTAILTDILSVKTGYLGQYRNQPAGAGAKRLDSLFTTSLVAKF